MTKMQALRQLQYRIGPDNMFIVQVTLVPTMSNEQKTKPTQHAVKERRRGLSSPTQEDMKELKKLARYLAGTVVPGQTDQ